MTCSLKECLAKYFSCHAFTTTLCVATTSLLPYILPYFSNESIVCLNLSSVALSFGTHIWVASIASPTMFNTLPKRTFGEVQSKLFPRYALLNTGCSLVAMYTWLHNNNLPMSAWSSKQNFEGMLLITAIAANMINSLWLINATTKYMLRIHAREVELDLPNEVGQRSQLKKAGNEEDKKLIMKFGMSHGGAMIMTIVSFGACGAFLYQMSKKIAFGYAIAQ